MPKENKKHVLIIEDDQMLIKSLETVLVSEGFEITFAIDGESGLKLAARDKPDLILLDIILPCLDGFAVLEELKKNSETKKIPVIILSNLGQEGEIRKGISLGAEDYLVKANVNLEEIVKKTSKILNK